MNIIITAGGTTEKIDPVRKISNSATGKLASLAAEEFIKQAGNRIEKIFYICEKGTIIPKQALLEVIYTEGVQEVKDALVRLLTTCKIDAVIHSMAVSDYMVNQVTTIDAISGLIAKKLINEKSIDFKNESLLTKLIASYMVENDSVLDNRKKIGSNYDNLIIHMNQTPKLIGMIKSLQPTTILVGFKLLTGVDMQQLLDVGYELLRKNDCDYVLANDLMEITMDQHIGYLMCADQSYQSYMTKEEIAGGIVEKVLANINEKEAAK